MDFDVLQLLHRCHREYRKETLRAQSLSETEYELCAHIAAHEGCSQEEAASALRMDKTTVAKALNVLEEKGCVERKADAADRRRKRLRLTEKGSEKLAGLAELHSRWLEELAGVLTAEELAQYESCCARLLKRAEELLEETEGKEP